MPEPVSIGIAAVGGKAVAGKAAAATSSAGSGAAGSVSPSPVFNLKSQATPVNVSSGPSNGVVDGSGAQSTIMHHMPCEPPTVPNSPSFFEEPFSSGHDLFNLRNGHGPLAEQQKPPGVRTIHEPKQELAPPESTSPDRAQTARQPDTQQPNGQQQDKRATTTTPETPDPPPDPPFDAPQPEGRAHEAPPDQVQDPRAPDARERSMQSVQPEYSERADTLPPMFGPTVEAGLLGFISAYFGIYVEGLADLGDLMFETFTIHGDKLGARDDWDQAREEFRTFSEVTGGIALDKDVRAATTGMLMGGVVLEVVSPNGKARAIKSSSKARAKKLSSKAMPKTKSRKHPPDFELFEQAARRPGFENHHIALKAIFERADDPIIKGIYRELRSVPLSSQTHQTLHKIINNELRRAGLMPGSGRAGTKATYNSKEVEQALQVLADTYRREGVDDFAEHVEGFMSAMRNAGLF